ncbi:MAG: TonB-dependent receptor [Pseudohongiellaceae bacterium]
MSTRTILSTLIGGCCLLPATTLAQSQPEDTGAGQEILVTAHRLPELQSETLAATSVITREDITASQPRDLFELLGTRAGIQTTRTGSHGAQTSLFLRGSESDHTLVLLDGVRINTASDGFARLEHLAPAQIERIEIVRGPHSSLYGSNAMGGVIQIFTRRPDGDDDSGISGNLDAGMGTERSLETRAGLDLRSGATHASLDVSHQQTDGIRPRNAPTPSTERSAYDNTAATLNLAHQLPSGGEVNASWTGGDASLTFDGGETDTTHHTVQAAAELPMTERWQTRLQLSHFRDDSLTRGNNPARSQTDRLSFTWQNRFSVADGDDLVLGADHDDDALLYQSSGARQADTERSNTGLFAVYGGSMGALDTTVSVRHDDNEQFGGETTGRLALGTTLGDNTRLRAAWGSAFKAPNLVDLYVDFPDFFFFANPELEPETAENIELGVDSRWLATDWSLSVFRNDIDDLITTNASFDSLTNIGEARIRGLEVSAGMQLLGWSVNAELTLLDHEDRSSGEPLARRPDEMFSLSLDRQLSRWHLHLDWQVRGAQRDLDPVTFGPSEVAGNGIVNTTLSYRMADQLDLRLKVGNVFDKEYEVVDGYNMHGRTAMFSTRLTF